MMAKSIAQQIKDIGPELQAMHPLVAPRIGPGSNDAYMDEIQRRLKMQSGPLGSPTNPKNEF